MIWRLRYTSAVKRQLRSIPNGGTRRDVENTLDNLQLDPTPADAHRLRGTRDDYRIRVDQFRIIYRVHRKRGIVRILRVEARSEHTYRGYNPKQVATFGG